MNNVTNNYGGIVNQDHAVTKIRSFVNNYPAAQPVSTAPRTGGIGVVAVKPAEMGALIDVFGLTRDRVTPNIYTGSVETADGTVDLVAAQALEPGQRSTMATLANLRQHHNPGLFVLVGIGGGINRALVLGDVVVAHRVIYYEMRRETAEATYRRGDDKVAPMAIIHAVNAFFTDHRDTARLESAAGPFRVLAGPIGSGEAVVMDAESKIREYLLTYNEKTLAVDMEAGGLTQFHHESPQPQPGWLVVRGISDLADRAKSYDAQPVAAHNAAVTLQHLLPYLPAGVGAR